MPETNARDVDLGLREARPELAPENFDYLPDRIAALNKRAHHWLAGDASWLFEDYINLKVGLLVQLRPRRKQEHVSPKHRCSTNPPPVAQPDVIRASALHRWRHKPVFIEVVGGDYSPQSVTQRVSSVCCIIGLDILQNNLFEVGILPAEIVKRAGPAAFSVFLSRDGCVETGFQIRKVGCEGEHRRSIGQPSDPRHFRDKIVECRPQIPDTVADQQGYLDEHGRDNQVLLDVIRKIHITTDSGCEMILDKHFPDIAEVVGARARPIKFSS